MDELVQMKAAAEPADEHLDELDVFRKTAADGMRASFLGTLLRFKKGKWIYGEDRRELEVGTRVVVLMNEIRRGWVRWEKGKATSHVVGKVVDGFVPPDRQTLGDLDEKRWPVGMSGKREDPWTFTIYAPMASIHESGEGDEVYTFATSSDGGCQCVYRLMERYAWLGRKEPGRYPVVALGDEVYDHKSYGELHKPTLEIVDWTHRPDVELTDAGAETKAETKTIEAAAEPSLADEMDEEIPF